MHNPFKPPGRKPLTPNAGSVAATTASAVLASGKAAVAACETETAVTVLSKEPALLQRLPQPTALAPIRPTQPGVFRAPAPHGTAAVTEAALQTADEELTRFYSVAYCNRKEAHKKRKNRSYADGVLKACLI